MNNLIKKHSWFFALLTVYCIYFFCFTVLKHFVSLPNLVQPFINFPSYLHVAWDSAWYHKLFIKYEHFTWPPFYPLTLKGIAFFISNKENLFEKSALLLNFVSHNGIAFFISIYCRTKFNLHTSAWKIILLLFFFPFHNVLFAAYSESFYLALTLLSFILNEKKKIFLSSFVAGIATMVRTMGAFLCLALVIQNILKLRNEKTLFSKQGFFSIASSSTGLILFIIWNVFVYLKSGHSIEYFQNP